MKGRDEAGELAFCCAVMTPQDHQQFDAVTAAAAEKLKKHDN